jgi:hypothetical protein
VRRDGVLSDVLVELSALAGFAGFAGFAGVMLSPAVLVLSRRLARG